MTFNLGGHHDHGIDVTCCVKIDCDFMLTLSEIKLDFLVFAGFGVLWHPYFRKMPCDYTLIHIQQSVVLLRPLNAFGKSYINVIYNRLEIMYSFFKTNGFLPKKVDGIGKNSVARLIILSFFNELCRCVKVFLQQFSRSKDPPFKNS